MEVGELAPRLWWWTAEHPDWDPRQSWDPAVRCFCVSTDDATVLVDPLVPRDDSDGFWETIDAAVRSNGAAVAVVLTQAAHARDAGVVAERYDAGVWGHVEASGKVGGARFHAVDAGTAVPGGRVLEFDQEVRGSGTPIYFPSHNAIAVGDVFISRDDGLYVWWGHGASDDGWFHERLVPSLRRWLDLPIEHVLVAHGPLVAASELRAALDRPPDRGE